MQAQPFDLIFVDDADLSPIVVVPLPILFPSLGYGCTDVLAAHKQGATWPRSIAQLRHALFRERLCDSGLDRVQISGPEA